MSYTLIRHSGYSVGGKPDFKHAVEEREVTTARQKGIVAQAGGLIYPNYAVAHQAAHTFNYPSDNKGIIPTARGKFVKRSGFPEEIFVPA